MKTLVEGQVWVIDNFLDPLDYKYIMKKYVEADLDMLHVNNKDMKPLMADTNMSYRVKSIDHFQPIYTKLEKSLDITLPPPQSKLCMQYKTFIKKDSYDLHAEDPLIYGEYVYILYLTDEEDGDITLPSEADHKTSKGFREMQEMFNVSFSPETISYRPKANTCLVMKTGIAHMVDACTGRRDSIAGWPGFVSKTKK